MALTMTNFSKKMKKYDACQLPPCKTELREQILRAAFVCSTWQNACNAVTPEGDPLMFGWKEQDEGGVISYAFKWFEGDQFPPTVKDISFPENTEDEEDDSLETGKNFRKNQYFYRYWKKACCTKLLVTRKTCAIKVIGNSIQNVCDLYF